MFVAATATVVVANMFDSAGLGGGAEVNQRNR